MASRLCLACYLPVFRIISERAPEYCCLNAECEGFKASMPEYATAAPDVLEMSGEIDYTSFPSAGNVFSPFLDQPDTPAWPQQFTQAGPSSVPQYAPAPEVEREELPWTADEIAQFAQEFTQAGPSNVPQSTPVRQVERAELPGAHIERPQVNNLRLPVKLQTPLSELPAVDGQDPMAQVTEFANRSVEQRRTEARDTGKVKRWSNGYALYQRAYSKQAVKVHEQNVKMGDKCDVKATCTLVPQSWALEPEKVRGIFFALAEVDKTLFKQAFPHYQRSHALPKK